MDQPLLPGPPSLKAGWGPRTRLVPWGSSILSEDIAGGTMGRSSRVGPSEGVRGVQGLRAGLCGWTLSGGMAGIRDREGRSRAGEAMKPGGD